MDWIAMIDRLGIPVSLLAAIAYGVWRCAGWAAPKLTDVTEAHLKFVATVGEQTVRQADQAEKQTSLLESQHALLKEQGQMLAEVHRHVQRPFPNAR